MVNDFLSLRLLLLKWRLISFFLITLFESENEVITRKLFSDFSYIFLKILYDFLVLTLLFVIIAILIIVRIFSFKKCHNSNLLFQYISRLFSYLPGYSKKCPGFHKLIFLLLKNDLGRISANNGIAETLDLDSCPELIV